MTSFVVPPFRTAHSAIRNSIARLATKLLPPISTGVSNASSLPIQPEMKCIKKPAFGGTASTNWTMKPCTIGRSGSAHESASPRLHQRDQGCEPGSSGRKYDRRPLARPALWRANLIEAARFHADRRADAGIGHRFDHHHLQRHL